MAVHRKIFTQYGHGFTLSLILCEIGYRFGANVSNLSRDRIIAAGGCTVVGPDPRAKRMRRVKILERRAMAERHGSGFGAGGSTGTGPE